MSQPLLTPYSFAQRFSSPPKLLGACDIQTFMACGNCFPSTSPMQFPYPMTLKQWGRAVSPNTEHAYSQPPLHQNQPQHAKTSSWGQGRNCFHCWQCLHPWRQTPLIHPCLAFCCPGCTSDSAFRSLLHLLQRINQERVTAVTYSLPHLCTSLLPPNAAPLHRSVCFLLFPSPPCL